MSDRTVLHEHSQLELQLNVARRLVTHSVQTPSYAVTRTLCLAWDTEITQTHITVSVKFK